jgi:hypothetical protein
MSDNQHKAFMAIDPKLSTRDRLRMLEAGIWEFPEPELTPEQKKISSYYKRQFAKLDQGKRSLEWTRLGCNYLFACPWVFFIAWGCYAARIHNNELGVSWRLGVAALLGLLHGTFNLMGQDGRGFFGALDRWKESLETRRKNLQENYDRDMKPDSGFKPADDHFAI